MNLFFNFLTITCISISLKTLPIFAYNDKKYDNFLKAEEFSTLREHIKNDNDKDIDLINITNEAWYYAAEYGAINILNLWINNEKELTESICPDTFFTYIIYSSHTKKLLNWIIEYKDNKSINKVFKQVFQFAFYYAKISETFELLFKLFNRNNFPELYKKFWDDDLVSDALEYNYLHMNETELIKVLNLFLSNFYSIFTKDEEREKEGNEQGTDWLWQYATEYKKPLLIKWLWENKIGLDSEYCKNLWLKMQKDSEMIIFLANNEIFINQRLRL